MTELLRDMRERPGWSLAGALVIAGLAFLPLNLNAYGIQVVMIGFFYVMLGISWNLLAGYTGQFSLAHHAFATIAGYTSGAAVLALKLPLLVAMGAGVLVAALLGFGLGWLTLGMRGVYFAISTW